MSRATWRGACGFAGALVFTAWTLAHRQVYFSNAVHLPHDTVSCYWNFRYIVLSLRFLRRFPDWNYFLRPGMWLQPYTNPYGILIPYKLLGYLPAALAPWSTLVSYKLSFLILGQGAFLVGVYLLAEKLFRSPVWALLAAVLALFSSATIALIPHEATMTTVFFAPFAWLVALDLPERPQRLPLLASLAGLSLNYHYPQLVLAYWGVVACGLAACPETRGWLRRAARACARPGLLALSAAAFLISAGPVLYSYGRFHDRLITRFRGPERSLAASDYSSYYQMAHLQQASAPLEDLRGYLRRDELVSLNHVDFDDVAVRSTDALLLALMALALGLPLAGGRFHALVIGALAALSCGIYGPMPRLLWHILPGIGLFRQWIHFTCFLNLHLIFLQVVILRHLASLGKIIPRWRLAGMAAAAAALAAAGAVDRAQAAVVLLAAGLPLVPRLPRGTGALLACAVTLFSSMRWASRQTDAFIGWQAEHYYLKVFPEDAAAFAAEAFEPSTHIHPVPLAEPRSDVPEPWAEGMQWTLPQDPAQAAAAGDTLVEARAGGFEIAPKRGPKGATALVLPQFDDGDWLARSSAGLIKTGRPGGPLSLEVKPGAPPFFLARRPSAWPALAALMWLPLALALGLFAA